MKFKYLDKEDKKIGDLVKREIERQKETINLIASENYVSSAVLEVLGSPLTNKYSEGYPGARYYPGNKIYDEIEKIAQERALKLFKLSAEEWGVNVQGYSGSPANLAVYLALINLGEIIMGMALNAGGHLTHGHKVSASGKFFKVAQYGVGEDGFIDYKELEKKALENKPKIIISGATAYAREIDFEKIGKIAKKAGAYHLADISHIAGLVVAGLHKSPFPYADIVMTTTHKTLRGPRGAVIFARRKKIIENNEIQKIEKKEETIFDRINKAVFPGVQGGPHNNVTAAKALAFLEAGKPSFRVYQKQIIKNAKVLAEELKKKGFSLVTGGTDNHLMLVDMRSVGLDGMGAERMLEEIGITANRNAVPGDEKPFRPSGVRMGTPAVTTRGMKEKEMKEIAEIIYGCLVKKESAVGLKKEVLKLCKKFPLMY